MRSFVLAVFVLELPAVQGQTCLDTCQWSLISDGDCDDGGPGSDYTSCPCGTDCFDCGSRVCPGQAPPSLPPSPTRSPYPPYSHNDRGGAANPVFFFFFLFILPLICVVHVTNHAKASAHRAERAAMDAAARPVPQAAPQVESQVAFGTAVPVMPAVTAVTAVGPNPTEELERLAGLRASGMLSEAEFEQAKMRVLGGGGGDVQMGQPMAQPAFNLFGAVPVARPVAQAV